MGFTQDHVENILQEKNFEILQMENDPEKNITRLTIVHDMHPEDEIFIDIISKNEEGEDVMEMQFSGPDSWTDDEAKMVLEEVMATLVEIIESSLDQEPEIEETIEGEEDNV